MLTFVGTFDDFAVLVGLSSVCPHVKLAERQTIVSFNEQPRSQIVDRRQWRGAGRASMSQRRR